MELVEYLDPDDHSPFAGWFGSLDAQAAAKISVALMRMEAGNLSNAKSVGSGVWENKLNWGPGYRVYFGKDGDMLIVLLAGGTKQRQQRDIETAKARWADYKQRKKESG